MEGTPKHPKTFGEELQRLRDEAGLSLEAISAETKISKRILVNLENGEFRYLPQKVFCRNFVAQYADLVGANPNDISDAFEAAWERFLLASGSYPSIEIEERPLVRTVRWRFWGPVAAAAAILVAAAFFILRNSNGDDQFSAQHRSRPAASDLRRMSPTVDNRAKTPSPVMRERTTRMVDTIMTRNCRGARIP